jgi:signal transduction histidine kinase
MATFRSKARLVEILGEHLIKDNTVGLLELVKNAYDADATAVEISLENLDFPRKTIITVKDNGDGMTLDTVEGPWLEPAHGGKELQKENEVRSHLGRLPLGEKGIGRFASHKLGKHLTLITRHRKSQKEVVLEIDWKPFESHDTYLEDIILKPIERQPELFTDSSHGTCLIMRDARERWREVDLRRLQASLQKLKSPTKGAANFEVKLQCSEYPQYENLNSVDLLHKAHFSLTGIIDEDGLIEFDYEAHFAGKRSRQQNQKRNLWHELYPKLNRKPRCGPLYLNLNAWIRKVDLLRQSGVTAEQLNTFCGVSLFRDGIRVLPYGDEGDDWLSLDKRRVNDPGKCFANNQIIGFLEINQTANQSLVDKANREGLQENEAFMDIRDLAQAAVKLLEHYSVGERNKATSTSDKKPDVAKTELTTTIEQVEEAARKSETEARAVGKAIETMESKGWLKPEHAEILAQKVEKLSVDVANYREKAETANQTIKEVFSDDEKEREAFLHLVSVGLIAERFTHEFARVVKHCAGTIQQLRILTKGDTNARDAVDNLERNIGELQNELMPLENLVHRSTLVGKEECDVPVLVETILANNRERLKNGKIAVSVQKNGNGKFVAPLRESLLAQVLDNLIDNAIHWLGEKTARDDRILVLRIDGEARTILVTNNGPPILPHVRPQLFQKFAAGKLKGRGLGLFICRELLRQQGATIDLIERDVDKNCLCGASFLIELPVKRKRSQ